MLSRCHIHLSFTCNCYFVQYNKTCIGVFLLPIDGIFVHCRVPANINSLVIIIIIVIIIITIIIKIIIYMIEMCFTITYREKRNNMYILTKERLDYENH